MKIIQIIILIIMKIKKSLKLKQKNLLNQIIINLIQKLIIIITIIMLKNKYFLKMMRQ